MKINHFLATHSIFTLEELDRFLCGQGNCSPQARQSLLSYHRARRHVGSIRQGLYYSVPAGSRPETQPVDPFLLAARLRDDAVLAYHSALALHGAAHSVREEFLFLSHHPPLRSLRFRGAAYRGLLPPKALGAEGLEVGVETVDRLGQDVRVTTLERTLVDVLDRPALGGGWEEIWRSLGAVEYFDLDQVTGYALLLDNATTTAKVGYFLEEHRDQWMVDDRHLEALRRRRPRQPRYLDRTGAPGSLVTGWNLIVPRSLSEQSWQEVT